MLIHAAVLRRLFGVHPTGILHIGAHRAEEYADYKKNGWLENGKVIWVEAQPALASLLERTLPAAESTIICAAAWDVEGETREFKVASNSQSSSLLEFGTHAQDYPDIVFTESFHVRTRRLDHVLTPLDPFDFVALDIQGAELNALKGLGDRIADVRWIYTECNKQEVYKGGADITALDDYLEDHGFVRVATRWAGSAGWGDCLYVRERETGLSGRTRQGAQQFLFLLYVGLASVWDRAREGKAVLLRAFARGGWR